MSSSAKSSSNYTCSYCSKKYIRKTDCGKHELLCELLHKNRKSPRETTIVSEECSGILTNKQLTAIVQELTFKYVKMEEKFETMQKWVVKQKKQINIINWLNENNAPTNTFNKMVIKDSVKAALIPSLRDYISNQISQNHIEHLIRTNLVETIQMILENNEAINNSSPIYCFEQKPNVFYIYIFTESSIVDGGGGSSTSTSSELNVSFSWVQMSKEELVSLLNFIHSKLLRELVAWKKQHEYAIKHEDKMSNLYNKTMIKLMDIDLSSDGVLAKIRTSLFTYLKKDLKNMIEYEFE
jgi:hypothetical protein